MKNYNYEKYKITFVREEFSNGLHILLYQDKTNPLISTSVLYHVGSKDESIGKKGFAHFFEHLMFEGTKNVKKGDYFKYIASNGGQNNAYTNQDETYYYEILPSNQLPLALWLESERMHHAKLDEKSLDLQREIVKEEKKMRVENQPYVRAISEIIPSLLFKNHPYQYPIIGFYEDLDSATKEDYNFFYKKYYVPNNAILSISGDFEINDAISLCKKYFSSIPRGGKNSEDLFKKKNFFKEDPILKEMTSTCIDPNVKVPVVFFAYRVTNIVSEDTYVLRILDQILSSGESSRIINSLVNHQQIASYAGSFLEIMEDYGIFIIYGIVNHGVQLDQLIHAMDKEIVLLKEKGITSYELKKQINFFEKKFISDNYYISSIISNLSHYHLYHQDANLINNELNKYLKITPQDVKRIANKYFNKNSRACVYNVPENFKFH